MMEMTKEKVIPSYGLDKDWQLQSSSGPAMAAELKAAIDKKEPIVVTLWTPHWTFNEFDLKMLEDPKNQYGDPDNVYAVSRKGFKEDSPLAYQIIDQFSWTKNKTRMSCSVFSLVCRTKKQRRNSWKTIRTSKNKCWKVRRVNSKQY